MKKHPDLALTGSTGHLGSALLPLLVDRGYRIRVLIHEQAPAFIDSAVETVRGSLTDPGSLAILVKGCRYVVHSAARVSIRSNRDPLLYETNFTGTCRLHEAARQAGVERFVHVSSIHVYDQLAAGEVLHEGSPYCSDRAPLYDRSKRDAQRWLLGQEAGGMEVMVVNPTAVAGPFDHKPSLIGKAILDLCHHRIPVLIRGGFDFVDVRDVAAGVLSALERGRSHQAYLLPGRWHSLKELQMIVAGLQGIRGALPELPSWTGFAGLPFIQLFALLRNRQPIYTREALTAIVQGHKHISSAKAAAELGYQPRPLTDTVADTLAWFKQTGYL